MPNVQKEIPSLGGSDALIQQQKLIQNPINTLTSTSRQFDGLYTLYLGLDKVILTTRPSFAKHILQKNNRNYIKSKLADPFKEMMGNGLLTSEGAYWLRQRRLIQPGFHKQRLKELTNIMIEHTNLFLDRLSKKVADGGADYQLDIKPAMMEVTMNVVMRSLFSQGISDEELKIVGDGIDQLQEYIMKQVRMPLMKPWFKLSGQHQHYHKIFNQLDKLIHKVIEDRKEMKERPGDLLTMLIESVYEDTGEGMTNEQLRDESLIMFVAGHETTALTMSWTWYLLSKHPEVTQKLLAEYDRVIGDRDVQFEDLMQLTYTEQVLNESMRLYSPAWILDRQALEADEIDGYEIPKDMIVNLFVYGMHRDPKYWDKAHHFIPERFSKENMKKHVPYSFIPFGGGPRQCIGKAFALFEMKIIMAQMLRKFRFKLMNKKPIHYEPMITLHPKDDILFSLEAR